MYYYIFVYVYVLFFFFFFIFFFFYHSFYIVLFFFFFFQAEDGIRDLTVTGVQTCALPICAGARCRHSFAARIEDDGDVRQHQRDHERRGEPLPDIETDVHISPLRRSEERRVGKECRSRWWPCR